MAGVSNPTLPGFNRKLDVTSEKNLLRVQKELRAVCYLAHKLSKCDFRVIEGFRSQARQNYLYSLGRTQPGKIVTWTRVSKHTFGKAIDVIPKVKNKAVYDRSLYNEIARAFTKASHLLGVEVKWLGHIGDLGHFELVK